jgi:tetratricopeptide (TPR) repeat protein
MIQQRSRIPAVMMLLALMAFGGGMMVARRGSAGVAPESELAALKAAVEKTDPRPEAWLAYAQALKSRADTLRSSDYYKSAAVAFDQVLKADPYQRAARLGGAYCRAILGQGSPGDADNFLKFMQETVAVDPKTAKAIFERPEVAVYLAQARFQSVKNDAIAGSMD